MRSNGQAFQICVHLWQKISHARNHAWIAHFLRRHYPHQVQGVVRFFSDLSARRLPRTSFSVRIRLRRMKSIMPNFCRASVPDAWRFTETPYKGRSFSQSSIRQVYQLFLPLYWCGKWRATDRSPVSKRSRRCRSRTYPFHPPSHRSSPYRSQR